uniref:N-alpha-acetyltransferase 50 n=1 Tax=Taeniopygia guttata TaxID=59729 RepID=A0A674HGZ8_TAEGU
DRILSLATGIGSTSDVPPRYSTAKQQQGGSSATDGCREKPAAEFFFHNRAALSLPRCGQGTERFRSTHSRWWDDLALEPSCYRPVSFRSRIELGDVTPHNIKQLKRLNQVIFPVSYNDKFYKDVLEVGELAKLAYFNDIAVGAVCCRVDHSQNQKRLYIMTLGCLAPYRRLGIGTKMLNHVLNICEKDGTFDNIYLHVQISNESAIDFYRKFGFEIIETKKNYYKRIEPADAHVLQKNLKAPCLGQNADVQKTDN